MISATTDPDDAADWPRLAFSARLHVMEKVGAGVDFASITTIGIMFGQNLHPYQDLVFSDLYPHHLGDGLAGGDADPWFFSCTAC